MENDMKAQITLAPYSAPIGIGSSQENWMGSRFRDSWVQFYLPRS